MTIPPGRPSLEHLDTGSEEAENTIPSADEGIGDGSAEEGSGRFRNWVSVVGKKAPELLKRGTDEELNPDYMVGRLGLTAERTN